MKSIKALGVILVFILIFIGVGRVFNFLTEQQALDYGGKVLGATLVLGLGAFILGLILGPKKPQDQNTPKGPGPQF